MENGYYRNIRPEIYGIVPKSAKRILEIGCAAGSFRLNFPGDIEYWGVEPVYEVAKQACKNGINVLYGTYDDVCNQIPDGYFDVIVCNDVIEHIFNTEEFIVSLKRKLATKGVIVGSIPNVRFWGNLLNLLIKKEWKYEEYGVLDRTHVRFFTARSFRRLLSNAGYELEVMVGIESVRLKIIKFLISPLLIFTGFDICAMQFMFKAINKEEF